MRAAFLQPIFNVYEIIISGYVVTAVVFVYWPANGKISIAENNRKLFLCDTHTRSVTTIV